MKLIRIIPDSRVDGCTVLFDNPKQLWVIGKHDIDKMIWKARRYLDSVAILAPDKDKVFLSSDELTYLGLPQGIYVGKRRKIWL